MLARKIVLASWMYNQSSVTGHTHRSLNFPSLTLGDLTYDQLHRGETPSADSASEPQNLFSADQSLYSWAVSWGLLGNHIYGRVANCAILSNCLGGHSAVPLNWGLNQRRHCRLACCCDLTSGRVQGQRCDPGGVSDMPLTILWSSESGMYHLVCKEWTGIPFTAVIEPKHARSVHYPALRARFSMVS
jgi:hypothetical protein